MTTRIAIVPKGLKYQKKIQTRVSSGRWLPKFGGMASASREKAFRHVWSKRGDRRLGFFQFRITRDDGTIINHTLLADRYTGISLFQEKVDASGYVLIGEAHAYEPVDYPDEIPFWNKIGDTWYYKRDKYEGFPVEFSYNTVTHIWTIPFYEWGDDWYPVRKGKKFYASFTCKDSVPATYIKSTKDNPEYIYKTHYSAAAVIRPMFYEVRVPYYKEDEYSNWVEPIDVPPTEWYLDYCGRDSTHGACYNNRAAIKKLTVNSSIDYTVNFNTHNVVPSAGWTGDFLYLECYGHTCEYCEEHWMYEPGWAWGPNDPTTIEQWVTAVCSNGVSSNDLKADPIDSDQVIIAIPYTVEENIFQMNANCTAPDPWNLEEICGGVLKQYPLDFKIWRVRFSISGTPDAW